MSLTIPKRNTTSTITKEEENPFLTPITSFKFPEQKSSLVIPQRTNTSLSTPTKINATENTPLVDFAGKGLDLINKGYTASADDTSLDVFVGALKELPKKTLQFFTAVGGGEADAVKGILSYADRWGLGGETTKDVIGALGNYSTSAKESVTERSNGLDTLGNAIGSQSFYFLPGLGISKLGGLANLTKLSKVSKLTGIGASSLLESAGEAGSVYENEKEKWGEEVAKGKSDFTFLSNIILNLATNKLGGMFNVGKKMSVLGEVEKILKGSMGEFTQEGIQQFISNIAEDRPMTEGALESALYGALLGGVGGGGNISQYSKPSDFISKDGIKLFKDLVKNEKGFQKLPGRKADIENKAVEIQKYIDKQPLIAGDVAKLAKYEASNRAGWDKPYTDQVEIVKGKIRRGEELAPIILKDVGDGNFAVDDGKHKLQAYKELGIKAIPAKDITGYYKSTESEISKTKTGKQQLAEREQVKADREQAILKRDSLVFNGELETQYQYFKKLKTKEVEDVTQLKAKNKGAEIDNILYSQEKTDNDVYEMFLNRYAKEKEALPQVPKETKAVTAEKARATATQKAKETRDRIVANIKAKQGTAIAVKQEIVDFAKTLDLKERGKLLATVKNAKTFKDLEKARDYIIRLGESAKSRKLTNAIQKTLKATIAKGAKPKGKYTPEIQATLDSIRGIVGVNQKQANLKLENNLSTYADKMPVEVAMENHLLSLYTGTIAEKKELLSIINNLIEKGEIASSLKKFNIQSDIIAKQDLIVERVTGGRGIESGRLKGEPIDKTTKQKVQQYFKTIGKKTILDWQGLMIASDFNVSVKEKPLSDFFSLGKNESKYKELQAKYKEDFDTAVSDIYGVKNKPNSILKKIHQLRDKVVIDNIEMTRDELIKRYMEIQDPTLIDSFKEGNKYTDKTLAEIESKISKQDKAFARWQLDYLQKFYKKVNAVYSKMTGVNLPFNEFYSPIKRVGVDLKPGHTEFLDEAVYRKAVTSKSLISRVKNLRPIAKQSSISSLDRHITDSNYYIAWAEKIRELDSIFTNNNVRESYRQELPSILSSIDNKIQHISTHGNKTASRIGWVDYIRKNYVVGNLAVKPALTIKQLVSTVAYAEKISSVQLVSGIIDFAKNPIKNYNTLKNESTFIKTRGLGMERDIREAMKEGVFDRYNKKQTLANNLLLNVKLGDKGAIVLGSWAMRKARLKAGDKLSDIIDEYEEFGANTQQSADISRLSEIQLGGSIEKLFTVFKTSQRAYLQKELNVVKSMFRKDGFGKENIKKVAKTLWIYHVLLPVFFQWISNMGGWDEDDKKDYLRAGLLGSLNGLFIAGDVIDGVIRQVLGMRVWDSEVIVADIGDDINKIISNLTEDDVSTEDLQQAMDAMASAGTGVTGLPLEYSYDFLESIYNGNYETGLKQLSGWSEYTIGAEEKETKAGLDDIFNIKSGTKKESLDDIFDL